MWGALMPQLHCYVADDVADVIRRRARARGLSVSALEDWGAE
jgi:hypothetical protein